MNRILCATDFSLRSELAIDRATVLARQFSAELVLLHIVDDDQPPLMMDRRREEAGAALASRIEAIRHQTGIAATLDIRCGTAFATIVETARSVKADLLVMGAHRRRLLSDVLTGTTLERVLRTGQHPVLIVNTATFVNYESVLLALDASDASARAARASKALGMLDGADLSVVHAFEPIYKGMMSWADVKNDAITEYSVTWAREAEGELRRFLESIELSEAAQNVVLEEGPPFAAIKRVVERMRPHLLVIGTRGHTGLKRMLLGSVAERVVGEIECDVLAVPPI